MTNPFFLSSIIALSIIALSALPYSAFSSSQDSNHNNTNTRMDSRLEQGEQETNTKRSSYVHDEGLDPKVNDTVNLNSYTVDKPKAKSKAYKTGDVILIGDAIYNFR